jgi:hypothetical protein
MIRYHYPMIVQLLQFQSVNVKYVLKIYQLNHYLVVYDQYIQNAFII